MTLNYWLGFLAGALLVVATVLVAYWRGKGLL